MKLILLILSLISVISAYKYKLGEISDRNPSMSRGEFVYFVTEGPMYSKSDSPYGGDTGYVKATINAYLSNDIASEVNLHVTLLNKYNIANIGNGYIKEPSDLAYATLCCTSDSSECGVPGDLLYRDDSGDPIDFRTFRIMSEPPSEPFVVQLPVNRSGEQYLTFISCSTSSSNDLSGYISDVNVEFKNPYGYTPGLYAGFLTYYVLFFGLHLIFGCIFGFRLIKYYRESIFLQRFMFVVYVLVVLSYLTTFSMYWSKNKSGIPVPTLSGSAEDATFDFVLSTILQCIRTTVSATLLLIVSMGYGLVYPSLPRDRWLMVGLLSTLHLCMSIYAKFEDKSMDNMTAGQADALRTIVDCVFMIWTYVSFARIITFLSGSHEKHKLSLYSRLLKVIYLCFLGYILIEVIQISYELGKFDVMWQYKFLLFSSWDFLYFTVFTVVCWLWSPSATSSQYALYDQSNDVENDDDDVGQDDDVDIDVDLESDNNPKKDFNGPVNDVELGQGRRGSFNKNRNFDIISGGQSSGELEMVAMTSPDRGRMYALNENVNVGSNVNGNRLNSNQSNMIQSVNSSNNRNNSSGSTLLAGGYLSQGMNPRMEVGSVTVDDEGPIVPSVVGMDDITYRTNVSRPPDFHAADNMPVMDVSDMETEFSTANSTTNFVSTRSRENLNGFSNSPGNVNTNASGRVHRRIETLPDDDGSDVDIEDIDIRLNHQ